MTKEQFEEMRRILRDARRVRDRMLDLLDSLNVPTTVPEAKQHLDYAITLLQDNEEGDWL